MRKDGTRFWASVVITALRDAEGRLVGFAKVTRDLTTRRRSEEELRASEERFRVLVRSVKDYGIFMLDPEGRVASWNEGARRIKGYEAEEILGRHFSTFYPPDVAASGHPARELEVARREGGYEEEGWRIRKDGSRFWASVVITALFGESGDLIGYAKVTRDLTERRLAQQREVDDARRLAEVRGVESSEDRLPRRDVARAAHAAERHRGLRAAHAGGSGRRRERAAPRLPHAHPEQPAAPARAS